MANSIRVLMQYRPGYPQTSTAIQEEIWIDISKRVDYQSLQWEQQATEQNTVLRFDIFTMLSLSTTRYDDYPSWVTSGSALNANTGTSLGMVDPVNDPSFFIDVANRTEVKVQEWEFVGGNYQIVKTLWGGVVSSVDTERNGDSFIVQRVECSDYTALLDELIIRDYNAPTVSEELAEQATISGLTTEVIAGGATLTAGPYTFRVVAYDASDEIVDIFTHVSQNLTATDIDPPGISDPPLRTIKLDWTSVAGATYYKVFAKSGIGVKDMYYKATVTSPTVTYNLSTAPAVSGDLSPEGKVQKGSIDIDIVRGSTDPANANYKGIFNAIDPDLDPGIDNQTAYVETAKKLNDGTPDPDKSYRFSPTLETGIVLTSPFGGKTIKQALNIITEKTGAVFWVDANKDLHYTNKQARELVENPRFESSPAATGFSVAAGHAITQDRGPFGYGRALVASAGATTAESKTDPIPVTANNYYFARVRGWAKTNFASHWDAELVFYSDTAGTIQVGSVHKLQRNIAFDSTDDGRWCKTWVLAQAHNTAVTARIVAKKKSNGSDEVAWTDFSLVEVTGSIGFSDTPSEVAYALPMKSFETPKAPRSASKVANRLLVYGVYKNLKNPSELESIETDISLTLKKVAAGSLSAAKYYVRVVATVGGKDVICTYATETITDQDVTDGNRELYASWAAVTGATQYKIYVGTKRFAMRLKATQAGTTLSIQTPAAGGAAVAPEPEVYYYKVFDFAPGIWESGGKILEAAINDSLVDNDEKAETRALSFWEEKGIAERTWEFDTFEETVPMVGEVIPFVWAADDTAEPLMVKGVKARLLGERVYYTVIVGDDPLLTKRGVTQIFADMQAATARLNDTIAPEPPQSLVVSAPSAALIQTPDGVTRASVTAQWTPSPEDDFAYYSVEYGYDPNFTEVQRANVSQTSDSQSSSTGVKANVVHTFQAEPGKTLYYRVAAIDQTNNRSQWSSDEIVTPQDTTPCDPPTALTVEPGLRSNTLTWSFDFYDPTTPLVNTENTDFARFRVYRRVHNTGSYVAVAETSATQYVDTDFANYTSGYNYAVTSLDRTGNESGAPGTGGATGVAYNTTNSVPSKINGGVDITTASITGAEIANATITDANIGSLSATKITTGTLNVSTGMTIVSDGTAASPQFEVGPNGVIIRDDGGNVVLEVNGSTANLNADYLNVTGIEASEVTVGSGNSVVRVGNYPNSVSPTFKGIWGGNANPTSAAFTLSTSGAMTATSASVTGSVTANSGAIGGWSLSSTSLTGGDTTISSAGDITLGTGENVARLSSSDPAYRLWLGGTTASTAPFRVTSTGAFTATDANISGTISASAGQIGGFTIGATSLTAGSGATAVGISPASYPFFAGSSTASTAPFSVTSAGVLTATSASVTGSVTASSGAIGGWIIDSDKVYNSSSNGRYVGLRSTASSTGLAIFAGADSTNGANSAFSVTNSGAVVATNISVLGGDVVIGKQGPALVSLAKDSAGIVTVITATAHEYTAGSKILIDVESGTYQNDTWANGYKTVLPDGITSTQLKYDSGSAGTISTVSVSGHLYNGSQMAVGGDGGLAAAWMTVNNKLSIKSPSTGADIIAVGADGVTINADFINAGSLNIGELDANALTTTNFSVTNAGVVTAGSGNNVAIISPTDPTYRLWLGHSTGSSAPFSVTSTGSVYATSGTVGGWTLSSTSLTGGNTTINSAGDITLGTGSNIARLSSSDAAYRLWLGATSASSAPFRVTSTGELTATSATISGSVTATAGAIGGWSLTSTSLSGGNTIISSTGDITVGTGSDVARLSSSDAAYRLWLGGTTASTAPFRVTTSGALTATGADITGIITATSGSFTGTISASAGQIGGWTINSDRITNLGSTKYAGIIDTALDTGLAFFAGATDTAGSGSSFSVTNAGVLAATGANVTGTISTNNITATGGTIGGWSLTSTSLTNYGGSTGQYAGILDTDSTGLAFFAGATTSTGTSASFTVTNAGALTATNATIQGAVTATSGSFTGAITANSGSIGGWSVDSSRIYNALAISPYISGLQGSSTSTGVAFFAGATTSTGTSAAFTVTNSGAVTASNLEVTGGGVGGWKIDTDKIYNALAVSPYISGLYRTSTSTGLAFFAGATTSTGTSATFSVNNLGAVSASNVSITGGPSGGNVINISSGQFSVDSAGYMNAKTGKFSPGSGTASSGQPALLLAGGSLTGDIAYASGQSLNFGVTTATQGANGAFTEYMRLDASGNLRLYSGYFAIGSSDVFKVDTSGNITITGNIVDAGDTVMQIAGGDLIIQHGTSGTTPRLLFRRGDGTYNAGINSDFAGDINFYSGSGTSSYADLYMDQLLPGNAIPMSAISGMTTVSDAISSGARWHQPAAGARWELKRSSSSQRYKNTIQYPDAEFLNIAKNIRPRFFKRNDETAGRRHLGFIAEEVHAAGLLEAVTYWDDGAGIMIDGIEPTAILATALLRIKDLEDRLEALENA